MKILLTYDVALVLKGYYDIANEEVVLVELN